MTTTTYTTGQTPPNPLTVDAGDTVVFEAAASAGTGQITNAGIVAFEGDSTADAATITTSKGGETTFSGNSTAGDAALVAASGGVVDVSGTTGAQGNGAISAGSLAGAGTFDLGADQLTVGANDASTTVSGVIADGGQAGGSGGSLVKTGTGTLTLTGSNTFSGGIDVTDGTLAVAKDASLGAAAGVVTLDGGTLATTASTSKVELSHAITLGALGGTLSAQSTMLVGLAGAISGTGGLTVAAGRSVLLGDNSYSGGTTINGKTLYLGSNDAGGEIETQFGTIETTLSGPIVNNSNLLVLNANLSGVPSIATTDGATTYIAQDLPLGLTLTTTSGADVDIDQNSTSGPSTYTLDLGGPGTYTIGGNVSVVIANATDGTPIDATIAGPQVGTGTMIKESAGTTIFAGASFSAGLTIESGVVQLGTTAQGTLSGTPDLSESATGLIENYAVMNIVDANSVGGNLSIDSGDLVTENGGQTNFYNDSDATNTVLDVETGGGVDFSRSLGAAGNGVVQVAGLTGGGGTIDLGSDQLEINAFGVSPLTFSGTLSDGGAAGGTGASVLVDGSTDEVFSGVNTYSGGTFIDDGTLSVASDASLGAASADVTLDGGTLEITSASFSSNRDFILDSGGGTLDYDFSGSIVIAGISGVGALTKIGPATAIFENANYTGGTDNADGVLEIGTTASGALTGAGGVTASLSGAVTNEGDGTLDFVNANTTGLTSLTDSSSNGTNFYNGTSPGTATVDLGGADTVNFYDESSAGQATITVPNILAFHESATAGSANIKLAYQDNSENSSLFFYDSSNAGHATITSYESFGVENADGDYASLTFAGTSSASDSTIYNVSSFSGVYFINSSTAGNSKIYTGVDIDIDNGIIFEDNSSGGNAALSAGLPASGGPGELDNFGNICFDGSGPNGNYTNTVGSIALASGSIVELHSTRLTIGSNDLSTTVDGAVSGSGSLVKVGTGTLTLAGFGYGDFYPQYTGGTTIEDGTIDLGTTTGAGPGAFTFAGSAGSVATLALETAVQPSSGDTFANTLDNFDDGLLPTQTYEDALDLKGLAYDGETTFITPVGTTLSVTESNKTETFTLGGTQALAYYAQSDGNGGTLITDTPMVCFAQGTAIRVRRDGAEVDVTVEALTVGDIAVTASGDHRPIRWLGHRTIDCLSHPSPHDAHPVRIAAHAFAPNQPARELFLSPGHPILVGADDDNDGGHLVPIMCLINGTTVRREAVDEVTYWHVELDAHDILLAENLPAESYIDLGSRPWFAGAGALYDPDLALPGMPGRCRPVAIDGAVVEAERRRLDGLFAMRLTAACAWPGAGDPLLAM